MSLYFIDIETTGLDPEQCQTIEVAAIEYGSTCPAFHCYIQHPYYNFEHGRIKRLGFPEYRDGVPTYSVVDFKTMFRGYLYGQDVEPKSVTFGGKNVGTFDIPFLKKLMPGLAHKHRYVDIGNLYLQPGDNTPPDLAECMKRAGMMPIVPHTALEDAQICVTLFGYWRQEWLTLRSGQLLCTVSPTQSCDSTCGGMSKA